MESYFFVFNIHFEWEDDEHQIVNAKVKFNDQYIGELALKTDSNVMCLINGDFDLPMPENDFRDFILKGAHRWAQDPERKKRLPRRQPRRC